MATDQDPALSQAFVDGTSTAIRSPPQRTSSTGTKKVVDFIRGIGRSSSKSSSKDQTSTDVSPTSTEASTNSFSTESGATNGSNKKRRQSRVPKAPVTTGRSGSFQSAKSISHPLDIVPVGQAGSTEQKQYATFSTFTRHRRRDDSDGDDEDDWYERNPRERSWMEM